MNCSVDARRWCRVVRAFYVVSRSCSTSCYVIASVLQTASSRTCLRVPRPLLPRLAAFEESSGWWSTRSTIERVCVVRARKSLRQRKQTRRGHAERCSTARTTAAHQGEARRNLESLFKWAASPASPGAGDVDALRGRPVERRRTRIELSLDGCLVARIAPRGVDAAAASRGDAHTTNLSKHERPPRRTRRRRPPLDHA